VFSFVGVRSAKWTAGFVLAAVTCYGCAIETASSPPARRSPQPGPVAKSAARVDPREAERLQRIMTPLLRAMDRPCRTDDVQVGLIDDNEVNAANAGSCQFLVTTGLLRKANDEQFRGVMAHEVAHQDLGHVAKAQVLGAGLNIGAAVLQQLFPAAGVIAPVAGTLIARGYGRQEEYAADRHGVDILRRAGYSKDTLVEALTWIRRTSGAGGGGFLSTHPALDDRISELKNLR
jgi:predicted Zn-dependent protease